ncbi:hypothetical protein H0H92_007231, partial [Tricholoma furcatifolium]
MTLRIVTESWIAYPEVFSTLERFINLVDEYIRFRNLDPLEDSYLVLDIDDEDENTCYYYYAQASTRRVFWLTAYDISHGAFGIRSESHLGLYLEYEYWYHWELFPQANSTTKDVLELVLAVITDCRTAVLTSPKDNIVYQTTEYLKEMGSIIECAMKLCHSESKSSWCIGRFMVLIMHIRFTNDHGERTASILLNANISFLAIPSNDPSNNSSVLLPTRRASQVASYVSVIASLASMMLALLLVLQYNVKESDSTEFIQHNRFYYGLGGSAILFSLPYVLLLWAVGTFLLAFILIWMSWDMAEGLNLDTLKRKWALAKRQWGRFFDHDDDNNDISIQDLGTGTSSANAGSQ